MIADKRVIKTRERIKNSFMLLTLDNSKEKISISLLTKKAQINRSTFYLHYEDINDVVADIEKEINDKISERMNEFEFGDIYKSTFKLFNSLTEILNENEIVKNYILFSTCSTYITNRLCEILVNITTEKILQQFPNHTKQAIIYPLNFAAFGIMGTYVKWAHMENNATTLNELIETVSALIEKTMEYLKTVS